MEKKAFLSRHPLGLILRTFATKVEDVPQRLAQVQAAVRQAKAVRVEGIPVFRRVDVLVHANRRYANMDCGNTYQALSEVFAGDETVVVSECTFGDPYCAQLNYGLAVQSRHRIDHSLILSPEATSYLTTETMSDVIDAACAGAKAVGVAINELGPSVFEGRLANTFCLWENVSLLAVGGFDLRAAVPLDDRRAHYMQGWHPEKGDVWYHLAGVEEVIPLARLVDQFGPCLAPITPRGEGIQAYKVPDRETQPELWERHVKKMGTKLERQTAHLALTGFDLSWLAGGVMPAYRK